ncbi:N-acetylmuramoyl-L-alanine amidase, partial [Clostridium sp. AF02-29]|uniref:N-acetylmuramoyl-L-alanine amidase n=1 Tax=Clostridium sp. AF02-29 TaxID=2292993 RepID=UPI00308116CC
MEKKKRIKRHAAGLCAGLGILFAASVPMTAFADTVYVNASKLNYRNQPSTASGAVLGTLPRGTELSRVKNNGEWSEVQIGGSKTTVYVASRYLTTSKPQSSTAKTGAATAGGTSTAAADGTVTVPDSLKAYVDKAYQVGMDSNWKYAGMSAINSGHAVFYHNGTSNRKNKVVAVNAGHGTAGGSKVKTFCHPDKTAKVTGGTTGAGATKAVAVSGGMTFADGTAESTVTLRMAQIFRDKLLAVGYDVLMIRDGSDVQLDNVARTVMANNKADCHIALHWDSTKTDKGAFYMSVPNNAAYRTMEPVASNWESHNKLGSALVGGLKQNGVKIFSSGSMEMDLTQTSYSTVPSIDIELGDGKSAHDDATLG